MAHKVVDMGNWKLRVPVCLLPEYLVSAIDFLIPDIAPGHTSWALQALDSIKVEGLLVARRAERPLLLRALRAKVHGEWKGQRRNWQHRRDKDILVNCG